MSLKKTQYIVYQSPEEQEIVDVYEINQSELEYIEYVGEDGEEEYVEECIVYSPSAVFVKEEESEATLDQDSSDANSFTVNNSSTSDHDYNLSEKVEKDPLTGAVYKFCCGRIFKNDNTYRAHKSRAHTQKYKKKCNGCGLFFRTKEKWLVHKKEPCRECIFCGEKFRSSIMLDKHFWESCNKEKPDDL